MILDRYEYLKEHYQEEIEWNKKSRENINSGVLPLPWQQLSKEENIKKNDEELMREQEDMRDNEDNYKKLKNNIDLFKSHYNDAFDPPIAFRSVNFDTFIRAIFLEGKRYFFVSTCNNIQWDIPKIIPVEKCEAYGKGDREQFSDGELYDGGWDEAYVQGETFFCLDANQLVTISDRFKGLNQKSS
jgi:hypothetical protein